MADSQWEEETATRREAAQPQRLGMSCSCVDEDHVTGTYVARSPVCFENFYVGVGGEVGACTNGKGGIDFHRRDMAPGTDSLRNDCGVVPNTAANVQHAVAGLDFQKTQKSGKGGWMTVVEPAALVDCHKHVLVEMHGVIVWGGLVTVGKALRAKNSPRPGTKIVFAGNRAESSEQDLRTNPASGAYLLGIFGSSPGKLRHCSSPQQVAASCSSVPLTYYGDFRELSQAATPRNSSYSAPNC
jgi:hypothetical protein